MKTLFTATVTAGFIALAVTAWQRHVSEDTGYSQDDQRALVYILDGADHAKWQRDVKSAGMAPQLAAAPAAGARRSRNRQRIRRRLRGARRARGVLTPWPGAR